MSRKSYSRNNFEMVIGFRATLQPMSTDLITDQVAANEPAPVDGLWLGHPRIAYLTDGHEHLALEANRNYRLRMWLVPTILQTQWHITTETHQRFV